MVVAAVVLILVLAGGGGSSRPRQAVVRAAPVTTTTVDPAAVKAEQDYRAYVERIGNIVQQSASGRGQVGRLVTGVENGCRISPFDASQQIRSVIDNRTSILNQLAGQAAAPNPEGQRIHSLLQQALQSSIEADIQYKGWMDYLYTDFYNTTPVGCPSGTPPKNAAYAAARTADARASDQKRQFVDAFDPVATRFGLQTWQESDF